MTVSTSVQANEAMPPGAPLLAFGEWLRRRRKQLDLTREKLAWRVGCSFETIKKIESGDLKPSAQLAELLASKLDVPLSEQEAFVKFARSGVLKDTLAFSGLPAAAAPLPPASPLVPGLPAPITSLLGRSREIQAARDLLRHNDLASPGAGVRLLTLTGPPGAGKTRLALAIANELRAEFADGAAFVGLASVDDPALVIPTIAHAFGVREVKSQTLQAELESYLRTKDLLLVLDNFEQVITAAARIGELLAAAPKLKIIVSSREALRVYGEQEFPVPALELPDIKHLPPVEALARYSAVALFVARARAVKPDFELNQENAEAVARMCALLDGLPLALEMAAAQIKRHPPARLLAQLEAKLVTLGGGLRDLTPRQQTLRGAMDWSFNLLNGDEQRVLGYLGLFAGGGELDALAAIVPEEESAMRRNLEGVLESLTDKNLVRREASDDAPTRYSMLEMIREYACEKLSESPDVGTLHRRHAEYFMVLAEQVAPQGAENAEATIWNRLEREHDNLRAALGWAVEQGETRAALRLVGALGGFWLARGYWSEGLAAAQRVIDLYVRTNDAAPTKNAAQALYAQALFVAARLAENRGEYERARTLYEGSLRHRRALGDTAAIVEALSGISLFSYMRGDRTAARAYCEEGLTRARSLDNPHSLVPLLNHLGRIEIGADNYPQARAYLNEALQLSRERRDKSGAAESLHNLGIASYSQGQYAVARTYYQESLELSRELGDLHGVRVTLNTLGVLSMCQGEWETARDYMKQALALARELEEGAGIALITCNLGRLALRQGELDQARRYAEEALEYGRAIGAEIAPVRLALQDLAAVALAEGDMGDAGVYAQQAHERWRAVGDVSGIADTLEQLGLIALARGDAISAQEQLEHALAIWREMDHQPSLAYSNFLLGYVYLRRGAWDESTEFFDHAATLAQTLQDSFVTALALYGLASGARKQGDIQRARRLRGEARAANSEFSRRLRGLPKMIQDNWSEDEKEPF